MEQYGVLVPILGAEEAFKLLRKLSLLDHQHLPIRRGKNILLPLIRELSENEVSTIASQVKEAITEVASFPEIEHQPRRLEDIVRNRIPPELIERLPHSVDLIGDVAIIELPENLQKFSTEIGEAILNVNRHARIVLQKRSETGGTFRTRRFEVIAGSGGTETVHHEFSCRYRLDISAVYFNPRLSHERMRVARGVKDGEVVVDMFAGVGPYSILVAKLRPQSTVYSVDINPQAIKYLKDNCFLNKVADRVIPLLHDVDGLAEKELRGVADRIVMNHPSQAVNFLPAACRILKGKGGGVIHFYAFANREESPKKVADLFESTIRGQKRRVESFGFCEIIKEVSSGRTQVAIDATVR